MVVRLLENKQELTANKSTQSNIADGDQEAKQWKNYVDVLKRTVDSMREICMAKQNILGCEEALMYLTSAVRDFQSLISSIHVELEWENSENRPNTIKWEVLGTHHRKTLSTKQLDENVPISPQKDETSCVQCRAKRRMNSDLSDDENSKKTNNDVYERLAYGKRSNVARQNESAYMQEMEEMRKQGCTTGKLTMPRSAMDIPQTKSSMAKIAASRQLLWQRHKKILTEKLSAKRRQEHSITLGNRRRSLPILAKQASNVKATTETNLESIRETHEDDKNEIVGGGTDLDNSSTKTHAGHFKTRSDGYAFDLLDMSGDREWEALTAEEESLKLEEESLAKEIEETESISIDEELQRRVILDFSDVNSETGWQSVVDEWTIDNDDLICDQNDIRREVAVETPKLTQQPSRFRQPGELVQIHQRLLSPLRKRNLDVEEIQKRQSKAEELRLMLQEQKAQRLRILHLKVEDVQRKRAELLEKKRLHLENKMEKAAENRQRNLDEIIKRAKDDDQRVLETNFINTMESERVRLDLQLKEQDREQRLLNLAEERSKQSRDKAIKEAAIDERKRTAEQQKADKLREQSIKKQERQSLIETQRNEAAESQRKKIRLYEERLKNIKSNEVADLENLRIKIQEKSNKGTKRHEDLIDRIRQKAIESSRNLNGFASLSDCAVPPSDLNYSLANNNCCKKCLKCNYIATSDLNLIVHLLSEVHLTNCSLKLSDVNFVYLKSELENVIKSVDGSAIIDDEDLTNPNVLNKKLRTKIKQKLGTIDLALDLNVANSALRQNFDKKSNELRNLIQDRQKFNEQQRKKLEHSLNDLRRHFVDQKMDNKHLLALSGYQSGLITFLLDFIFKSTSNGFECSSKLFYRLIGKISHFLLDLLSVNSKICCAILFSDCVFNLLEWTSNQIETSNGEFEERTEILIAVYCILLSVLQEGSKFVGSTKHANQLNDRQQAIAMYLNNSNFVTYYKHTILNGTELTEFGFGNNARPLNVLSNLVLALNYDQDVGKKSENHVLNLHLTVVQCLILEIYAKIRFDPIVSSDAVSSGTLMSSSLISTNSSNWHTNSNVDVECSSLLNLWNSIYSKLPADSSTKQKRLENLKDDEMLRFVYILIVSICNNDKVLNLPSNETYLTYNSTSLPAILEATANFASLSSKNQIMCTIGWQKSLLVHISKLPFEYFQQPNIRFYLLTALIVILLNNMEGIALIREYITPTWMAEFLKEVINSKLKDEDKRRFKKYVSEEKWRYALEFFENID